jgi:catechol 2,3-dioxygenase-like lactoylglutathione lyase family enzyme
MRKLQSQGVHHITLVGADRQTSIDFWEGVLGMPFVFEQPNLDNPGESHLYFDPGDGRLITIFTDEARTGDPARTSTEPGAVHHVAFSLSNASFRQAVERLDERGIRHSGVKDRGFMDSIYFEDPLGLLIELASYRFEPPSGTPTPTCCSRRTSCASPATTTTSRRSTWPTRSRRSSRARDRPCPTTATPRIPTASRPSARPSRARP